VVVVHTIPGGESVVVLSRSETTECQNFGSARMSRRDATVVKTAPHATAKIRPRPSAKARLADRGGQASALAFVPPQLATLVDAAPVGDEWLHEVKFDGFRILCRIEDREVTLFTRTGQDWTDRFAEVAVAAARLNAKSALIDGEVAVLRADGTTSFQSLQNHLQGGVNGALTYFAFDLLFLNGVDLRPRPLEERKVALHRLIEKGSEGGSTWKAKDSVVRYTDHVVGNGPAFFEKACAVGLEGIVSKRRNEAYHSGRGPAWVKTKSLKRQEFVVGGFTEPEGSRSGIGALLVGFFRDGLLVHAGKVGTGFSQKVALDLRARLDRLVTAQSPFQSAIAGAGRQIRWVKPHVVVEIAYSEMTADGKLRHPSFQGLREDKPATDVVQEIPREAPIRPHHDAKESKADRGIPGQKTGPARTPKSARVQVAGVTLSHPERLLDGGARVTKQDLAEYYEVVAPLMLPHLVGRPLSLVRCPEGTAKKCFFMKHAAFATPELRRLTIQEKEEKGDYLIADTLGGLISLAQMSVLEIHTWNSVEETLEMPDRVVFDFDPGPSANWADVIDGALMVKDRVERIGCVAFVKTTGGKGLHVVVPLAPNASWDECKVFSQLVSESIVAEHPKRFTTAMRKAGREDKILIDYFRNNRGSTSVSAFSTRIHPGIPVSLPIAWEQLGTFSPASPFTLSSTLRLLRDAYRDPWSKYEASRVDLKDAILKGDTRRAGSARPKRR
jgi:bifunctional non-homologous end joining protein LigD